MSYPNDAPAAAWYPDPQTSGQVRWWDGRAWTEHVSKPAEAAPAVAATPAVVTPAAATQTVAEQLAAPIVPQVAEADAAFAAADSHASAQLAAEHTATVTYIGRHAAGATPAPRQPSTAPRIRPRVRATVPVEVPAESQLAALAYA